MLPLLDIHDLSIDFTTEQQNVRAVKKISFSVSRNEIFALVGESGSGKSVTALSILQLLPSPPANYSGGEIIFSENGTDARQLLKAGNAVLQKIRGNRIGIIFQEPMSSLNPVFTCGYQVAEAIRLHKKITPAAAKEKTIEWFGRVKLPEPQKIFARYPHQLSGGQKQRVMIAMALCCEPALLICDEPTTALDVTVQKNILQLIKELQRQTGMGVIFITHDLGVVAEIADRAAVMYRGEIIEQNTVNNIFKNPQQNYTRALLACRPVNHPKEEPLPVVSDFIQEEKIKPGTLVKSMKSLSKAGKENESTNDPDESPVILARNLTVKFPGKKNFWGRPAYHTLAIDHISFEILAGETLGLVGESGCGKTTLGRALLGAIKPDEGEIFYHGAGISAMKQRELVHLRKDVQLVFQDPYSSLNPRLSIGTAITEPMKVHGILGSASRRKEKAIDLLEKVSLAPDHFNRYPHEFSGGQRQRIVIARALAMNPSLLVCDESVSALDVSIQAQVLNLLNELKKELGFTMVFISHDLGVVHYMSDRIMVMSKGKIEEMGKAADVFLHPQSACTKNLLDSIPAIPAFT
jgi:peptide/nickel transport system ATP-binding protein